MILADQTHERVGGPPRVSYTPSEPHVDHARAKQDPPLTPAADHVLSSLSRDGVTLQVLTEISGVLGTHTKMVLLGRDGHSEWRATPDDCLKKLKLSASVR